ncbi:MAG: TrkA C-terminal domain-containing protein [Dehalococcoidia bacterium]|nr:TrkA C-terminal domain-containing protein [Dehalococcoidia bacterium]
MQPELMLVVITIWMFILWFGSIALEATGMERRKARFQALSALTGTGFSTREAEDVVNHPRRRLIAGWMMFLGSVGIILFLLLILVIIVVGVKPAKPTSSVSLVLSALPALALLVLYWIGVADKLATVIVSWLKRTAYFRPELSNTEIIYQAGEHSLARLTVGKAGPEVGSKISDTRLARGNIKVLAIERGDKVLFYPEAKEVVRAGDRLIYYGSTEEIRKTLIED